LRFVPTVSRVAKILCRKLAEAAQSGRREAKAESSHYTPRTSTKTGLRLRCPRVTVRVYAQLLRTVTILGDHTIQGRFAIISAFAFAYSLATYRALAGICIAGSKPQYFA